MNILKILKTPNPEDIQLLKTENLTTHKTENIGRMLEETEGLKTSTKKLFFVKLFIANIQIYCNKKWIFYRKEEKNDEGTIKAGT